MADLLYFFGTWIFNLDLLIRPNTNGSKWGELEPEVFTHPPSNKNMCFFSCQGVFHDPTCGNLPQRHQHEIQ